MQWITEITDFGEHKSQDGHVNLKLDDFIYQKKLLCLFKENKLPSLMDHTQHYSLYAHLQPEKRKILNHLVYTLFILRLLL